MTCCYGYENARNMEKGATVEKKQLSEDLYYKIKQQKRTLSFSYFIQLESKGYSKEIPKVIINTLYSYL